MEAAEVTKVTWVAADIVGPMGSMVTGTGSGPMDPPTPSTEAGELIAVGIHIREVHRCLGWPRQVLKHGVTQGVTEIISIGVGPMVQPLVMGVATEEATGTAEKATEHHGK